jgi:hypothetical protein
MTNSPSGLASDPLRPPTASRSFSRRSARSGKFSEHDLSSLKNADDLVTQVIAKYGLEKSIAKMRDRVSHD